MKHNVSKANMDVITSKNGYLCKEFFIDENGQIDKESHGQLTQGSVESGELTLPELKRTIKYLNNDEALCIGSRKPEFKTISSITTKSEIVKGKTIARSKDYFEFNDNPTFMLLDYDEKKLTTSELHSKLLELVPELEGVGMLIVPSSSAGVYISSDTEPTETKSSCHIYMIVEKGSCIPEIGEFIKYRAWKAGLGFIKITKTGTALTRHIFDEAVYSPERLVFDAPPLLKKGLSQVPRQIIHIEGGMADCSMLKMTDAQRTELASLIKDAKLKAQPECDGIRNQFRKTEVEKLITSGKTKAEAEKIMEKRFEGVLTDSIELRSQKYGVVTVGEILDDPNKFKDDDFIDPDETDTGTEYRAKVFFNENGSVILNSFRHGGGKYRLVSLSKEAHNEILDNEQHHCVVNLLQHLDDSHPFKNLCQEASRAMNLPESSIFLMGLAVFSSVGCRKYIIKEDNRTIPTGIYAVAEHPPATGKSWCLGVFQKPFFDSHKEKSDLYYEELMRLKNIKSKLTDEDKQSLMELENNPPVVLFTTNTTPEALEKSLNSSKGFFSTVSSEQGLFDSLFGLSYTDGKKSNNNDLILNGFDGGYMNSLRISRDGFNGNVSGGVALFAQQGSIEKLLNASNGTGLSERFLMIAEAHNLGKRDHTEDKTIPESTIHNYKRVAKSICQAVLNKEELSTLTISDEGRKLIALYQNKIEPHLADGGEYSHFSLRGAAGKIDMQIMKIAANLHLLAPDNKLNLKNTDRLKQLKNDSEIDDKYIQAAIGIANELLEANLKLCKDKAILGKKAEYIAVLNYLTKKGGKTMRELVNSLRTTVPFKESSGNPSPEIKKAITEMCEKHILTCTDSKYSIA